MKRLRVGEPIAVGGTILIPVERTAVSVESHRRAHWLSATKEVVAVVVCGPDRLRVIDVQARERPIEELIGQIPDLAAVISKYVAS